MIIGSELENINEKANQLIKELKNIILQEYTKHNNPVFIITTLANLFTSLCSQICHEVKYKSAIELHRQVSINTAADFFRYMLESARYSDKEQSDKSKLEEKIIFKRDEMLDSFCYILRQVVVNYYDNSTSSDLRH